MGTGVQYIPHHSIDKAKWDACIDNASNGLIYAYSFYLDHMAGKWDALILGDYSAVMPLTWNSKYGIRYLYQPFLTAQLGVFGKEITEELTGDFINAIPSSFRLVEISLNSSNNGGIPGNLVTYRNNYLLDLSKTYDQLYNSYNENTRRNARKALQSGAIAEKGFDVEKVIRLAIAQMKDHGSQVAENVNRFRKLYSHLHDKKMAVTYGISLNNELLACCVFFFSRKRAYYILVGNHPQSRTTGASHALADAFIKDHAGQNMTLDFEGSDIPGLASFYSGFGAVNEQYPFLRINRLPFYLKWMKR